MVSARLVDLPDSPNANEMRPIPDMMFAAGEEPVGVRVLTYQSSTALKRIFNALDEDEVDVIRRSTFGKLIEIAEKPVFLGRFARYLLSRQMKTKKKHEVWFRFCRKPVRFSLKEFAIVTGLPCGKFPRRSKMKLKKSIAAQPYWPTLFGKVEYVTVSAVIKMLYKKTVKDKEIRIKYACLALLESVLLPTSLNMKIAREHVEAIDNLEAFFAYPWGRVAFDLLMGSIKERDEISLSQNTIALKGFVLALQLVLVEAVPALTDAVEDTCSSSESDGEDIDGMGRDVFSKKQSLNPAHARNLDKQSDVIVHSVLDEDYCGPIDQAMLVYSDEEHDSRVENLLEGIHTAANYNLDSFRGGLTKVEVELKRQSLKSSAKAKKRKTPTSNRADSDTTYIEAVVLEKLKPRFAILEKNLQGACSRVDEVERKVNGQVEVVLDKFKEDILVYVKDMVSALVKEYFSAQEEAENVPHTCANEVSIAATEVHPVVDANTITIRNVLRTLSEYSTPPRSTPMSQDDNISPIKQPIHGGADSERRRRVPESTTQSANTEHFARQNSFQQSLEEHQRRPQHLEAEPTFSLGLTQDAQSQAVDNNLPVGNDVEAPMPATLDDADNNEERQSSRKSKRQKTVPSGLVETYECGPHLLSRLRDSQKFVFLLDDMSEMERKFQNLSTNQSRSCFVNVAGTAVSVNEILQIVERKRNFSAKVVDVLIRVLRAGILRQLPSEGPMSSTFLDTKFVTAIIRNYPKFLKSTKKEEYNFPTGLSDVFPKKDDPKIFPSRYYFPFNVGNKHWVGICFDARTGIVTILDCDTTLYRHASMEKYINPIVQMLPYLARYACQVEGEEPIIQCYDVARPKHVAMKQKPFDSGLMSVLMMATHAVYGSEACKNFRGDVLNDEGKRAAILAFEFKEKL